MHFCACFVVKLGKESPIITEFCTYFVVKMDKKITGVIKNNQRKKLMRSYCSIFNYYKLLASSINLDRCNITIMKINNNITHNMKHSNL